MCRQRTTDWESEEEGLSWLVKLPWLLAQPEWCLVFVISLWKAMNKIDVHSNQKMQVTASIRDAVDKKKPAFVIKVSYKLRRRWSLNRFRFYQFLYSYCYDFVSSLCWLVTSGWRKGRGIRVWLTWWRKGSWASQRGSKFGRDLRGTTYFLWKE